MIKSQPLTVREEEASSRFVMFGHGAAVPWLRNWRTQGISKVKMLKDFERDSSSDDVIEAFKF